MLRVLTNPFLLFAVVAFAWAMPFLRALRLFHTAAAAYHDTGSIADSNDYVFSQQLLLSYQFSFLVGIFVAWFFFLKRIRLLLFPLVASLFVAFDVIYREPEHVIVIFPTMHPFRPAAWSFAITVLTCFILWLHRGRKKVFYGTTRTR